MFPLLPEHSEKKREKKKITNIKFKIIFSDTVTPITDSCHSVIVLQVFGDHHSNLRNQYNPHEPVKNHQEQVYNAQNICSFHHHQQQGARGGAIHIIIIRLSRCCKGCFQIVGMSPICRRTLFACWEGRLAYPSFHFFTQYTLYIHCTKTSIVSDIYTKNETQAQQPSLKNKTCQSFYLGRDHASRNTSCGRS